MRVSLAIILWLLMSCNAYADSLNYDAFSKIPIQHEGRIKPLATFALVESQRFHGSAEVDHTTATAWLASVMFDPGNAMEKPLFLVKDTDAQSMLNLPAKPDNLYSFAEVTQAIFGNKTLIEPLLEKRPDELSPGQKAVVQLYNDSGAFAQIALSCTLFLPLSIDLPGKPPSPLSTFTDYYHDLPALQESMKSIITHKGTNPDNYSTDELRLSKALETLTMTMESSQNNNLLRVIPPQWSQDDNWLSPWAMFYGGQGSPKTAKLTSLWKQLAAAYRLHDNSQWMQASSQLLHETSTTPGVRPAALSLEVMYYHWSLLDKSMLLYVTGFILILFCMSGLAVRPVRIAALLSVGTGALLHIITILSRIFILERPPVSTLYESLLFVSLIAVSFGLLLEWRLRNNLGLLVATVAGSVLLFASQSFSGEDTMNMLIAVLNTNFWLATHVLCITTGYGFGMVAGIIAHVYLIMRCLNRPADKTRQVLRGGYGTALIALLFTSLGTILGGIWADQSWGRFWGWDPKENGALLICLWLIWILHSRITGHFKERGFAAGLSLLNVVISLSWLGVNLLSTGLHSYGFTDKAAWGLGAFCGAEFLFVAITYIVIWRRDDAKT